MTKTRESWIIRETRDFLECRGYNPTKKQIEELADIYEDCQEWDNGEMLTGNTLAELEDFLKHSSTVDDVLGAGLEVAYGNV